jgi:hypothetical protein
MKWIQCYMKTINYIKYTNYELAPEYYSMEINKFLEYLRTQCDPITNYGEFIRQLQSFTPIVINIDERSWFRLDFDQKATDAELLELNKDKIITNKNPEKKEQVMDGYSYFNNKSNKAGNEVFSNYFKDLSKAVKDKWGF